MKKMMYLAIMIAMMTVMSSCGSVESKQKKDDPQTINRYNICLVLDGTDRLTNENGVPQISSSEVVKLAKTLAKNGVGSFYLSYVDANCDNNKVAIFDWHKKHPIEPGIKPGYMKMSEYKEMTKTYKTDSLSYSSSLVDAVGMFSRDCERICNIAYSDEVAKQKNGSDVNGAINQAIRLLRANEQQSDYSYIILVSDGCDNVGKELTFFPQSTELLIVNSNVAKHLYEDIVEREFVTLYQVSNYIFNH